MKDERIVFNSKKELNTRINNHIKPKLEEVRVETVKKTSTSLYYLVLMILIDDFNFNKEQIKKFSEKYLSKIECLAGDYVTLKDIEDWCKENGYEISKS